MKRIFRFSVDPLLPESRHQALKALLQLTAEVRIIPPAKEEQETETRDR